MDRCQLQVIESAPLHMSRNSQDLTLHTVLPDGVTTVRQTLGRGFERNRLVSATNPVRRSTRHFHQCGSPVTLLAKDYVR